MAEHRAGGSRAAARSAGARRATPVSGRRHPRARRRLVAVGLLAAGVLIGTNGAGTLAFWTDESIVTSAPIQSGTMDLQFDTNGAIGLATPYAKADVTWNNLTPGEHKAFNLTVKNVGNPTFTYTATVTRAASPTWSYVGTPVTVQFFAGSRTALDTTYPQQETCTGAALGPAQAVDGTAKSVLTAAQTILGGGQQDVCMVVGIDPAATNNNQGKTGALAFSFAATQVVP